MEPFSRHRKSRFAARLPPNAKVGRDERLATDDNLTADAQADWEYKTKLKDGKNELTFYLDRDQNVKTTLSVSYQAAVAATTPTTAAATTATSAPLTPARSTQVPAATQPPAPTQAPPAATTQIVSLTSPIGRGYMAVLTAKTSPNANCSLAYTTPASTASTAQGLGAKTADGAGNVSWTWEISGNTGPGNGTVRVTCAGQTVTATITITA